MANIIDSEQEIANSADFTDIRFIVVQDTIAHEEDDDLDIVLDIPWSGPSEAELLAEMSAICQEDLLGDRCSSRSG